MTADAQHVVRFMDFSVSPEPIRFKMEDDVFECLPDIPLDVLADMAEFAAGKTSGKESILRVYDLFDAVMTHDSAAKLRERAGRGSQQPIGQRLLTQVLPWLLECYGLRPTQSSSDSVPGSDDIAITSTDGASPGE